MEFTFQVAILIFWEEGGTGRQTYVVAKAGMLTFRRGIGKALRTALSLALIFAPYF
jgi:hypothetical protein